MRESSLEPEQAAVLSMYCSSMPFEDRSCARSWVSGVMLQLKASNSSGGPHGVSNAANVSASTLPDSAEPEQIA